MAVDTREVRLPSNGRLGDVELVTIRNMTGADEKVIYSGVTESAIDKLLKRCIVEPKDLDVSELCEQDKYFLLMQIRILTFGSDYSFVTKCSECRAKFNVEMDLGDLEVFYADDKFEDSLHCTSPSGDEIVFKILTSKDISAVNALTSKLKANNDKGTQMILRLASVIESINGEKLGLIEKQRFLEESSSRDVNYLWRAYGRIKLGVNMMLAVECPACGIVEEVPVEMNAEFFRPSIED